MNAPMTLAGLQAISPLIIVTLTAVLVMFATAFTPKHWLINRLTLLGLFCAIYSLTYAVELGPQQVTPLLFMDGFALYFSGLVLLATLAVSLMSFRYWGGLEPEGFVQPGEFYILLLCATLGALVLVASSHFAAFFIGLELLGVSFYVLVAYLCQHKIGRAASLEAGIKYLILSGVASALLLFGIALLYAEFGSLSFDELGEVWGQGNANLYHLIGVGLVVAGVCFKLSLAPFHLWTPDIYQGAPAPVTAYLATVSKGALVVVLLRALMETSALKQEALVVALTALAILSMIVGNLLALMQQRLKRMLAYSSIAHMGYLMIPIIAGAAGQIDLASVNESVTLYITAYVIMTLGAFTVVAAVSSFYDEEDNEHMDFYRGLFWARPGLAAMLLVMLLSLAGIPLTMGFVGKFYLFLAGAEGVLFWLLGALILGSALGLYYYLRWFILLFAESYNGQRHQTLEFLLGDYIVLGVCSLLLLVLGIYPQPLIEAVRVLVS